MVSTATRPISDPLMTYRLVMSRSVSTPASFVDCGLPPTAYTRRPKVVRSSTNPPTVKTTAPMMTGTGTGPTSARPIAMNESGKPNTERAFVTR